MKRHAVSLVCLALLAAGLPACGESEAAHGPRFPTGAAPPPKVDEFVASMVLAEPPPPFAYLYDGEALECVECHDDPEDFNPERREFKAEHSDIVFQHDAQNRWCLDCHDAENRGMLRLANGALVLPEQSYRLCGQCHGDKYRDWRAGVHGRLVGHWDGEKRYRLCVHCHDAHAPQFQPIAPEPRPLRPEEKR